MQAQAKAVLVVEDSIIVVKRLITDLKEILHNTNIVSVLKGNDALTLVENMKPAAVLLDVHLPDISGAEVLKQIRLIYPEIKVVMLTNQSAAHMRKACLKEGAAGFYDKSNEFEMAIKHISRLVL